eukprot:266567_1
MAQRNKIEQEQCMKISERFETAALHDINKIRSNHVLFQLLCTPLPRKAVTIITLALQQRRLSFLNNERVLMCAQQIWNGFGRYMENDIQSELAYQLSYYKLLRISLFTPFRFYLSPVGYNYTCCILFLSYLMYVLLYTYCVAKAQGSYIMDLILWILNTGYVCHSFSEWKEKRVGYLLGSKIFMDILISFVWIVLFAVNIYIFKTFNAEPEKYKTISELVDQNWSSESSMEYLSVKAYILIFAIQIILLLLRCLSLLRIVHRLGEFLCIMQMLMMQISWFILVTLFTVTVFSSVFFFITTLENTGSSDDYSFIDTILVTFEIFVGTNDEITVSSVFTGLLAICIFLVLMNLLVAVMTAEYETFVKRAEKEVSYLRIATAIDLSQKHRTIPPPINLLVQPVAVIIHILIILFSICSCCHLYSKINRRTYDFLHSCYCGCRNTHRRNCCRTINISSYNESYESFWYRKNKWYVFSELIGLRSFYRMYSSIGKRYNKQQRRVQIHNPLKAYHKGCYSKIKLESKQEKTERDAVVKGITMVEYIEKYKRIHSGTCLSDTITLQRLNPNALFCRHCYEPYTERHVDISLTTPFHVLLDFISCFLFLFTAWLPLIIFLGFMTITDYLMKIAIGTEN